MQLYELLNELLELLISCSEEIKDKHTITLTNTNTSKNIFKYKEGTYTYNFTYTKDYPLTFFEIKDTFKFKKTLQTLYQEFSKKNKGIFHIDTIEMYIIEKV